MDWMAQALHLPECFLSTGEGGGVIQLSASDTIVVMMIAARERYLRLACADIEHEVKEDKATNVKAKMVVLASEQTHSSTAKAAKILGVKCKEIPVELEDSLALTGKAFQVALDECHREGLEPFFLTASLGTTATCATDHFADIISINNDAERNPFAANPPWIHVDAAYAGAALVCEEYAHVAEPLNGVDSFNVNMSKWLLTNFDASLAFVRKRVELTSAMSITRSYLQNAHSDKGLVTDYRDWQIPLGRRFRSLKIWFVLRTYGVSGMKAHVRRHIQLGDQFAKWISSRSDLFVIPTPPVYALTVVVLKAGNACAKMVYERINASGKLYITSGVVKDIYALRFVAGNEHSDEVHMRKAFNLLVQTTEEVIAENSNKDVPYLNGHKDH